MPNGREFLQRFEKEVKEEGTAVMESARVKERVEKAGMEPFLVIRTEKRCENVETSMGRSRAFFNAQSRLPNFRREGGKGSKVGGRDGHGNKNGSGRVDLPRDGG